MSLNVRNGKGFLQKVVFNLDLEKLEVSFKGILDNVGPQPAELYVMGEEVQQYDLGVYNGRQIRLELVRYRLWVVLNVLLRSLGFLSSVVGNIRDVRAGHHLLILDELLKHIVYINILHRFLGIF